MWVKFPVRTCSDLETEGGKGKLNPCSFHEHSFHELNIKGILSSKEDNFCYQPSQVRQEESHLSMYS